MKAVIVANGECNYWCEGDLFIACDGGLRYFLETKPDCIIGDLDSAPKEALERFGDVPLLRFPARKDETDLELALIYACEQGATQIVVLGGFGGRLDHQLANAHALAWAVKQGVSCEMRDETTRLMLIKDQCRLHRKDGILISLIPLTTSAEGIVTTGLEYPLNNESLYAGFARGVSNRITEEQAEINLKAGLLFVIQTKED